MLISDGELNVFGTVVLDGSGNGTLRFAPAGTRWTVQNVSVSVATATNEAVATIFKGQIGSRFQVSNTFSGSSGDNDPETHLLLEDGNPMFVQWEGGDAGALATAIVRGRQEVVARGFRVV